MESTPTNEPTPPRLLAIDDSALIHRLLKARLRHERIEIHCATTAQQGLAAARQLQPDVILLDIDLPDMDGFAVLAALKDAGATHDIPVIFLSASAGTESKVRGLDLGAVDFITKPFEIAELRARVRSAIRVRHLIRMLAQKAQIDGLTGLWNRAYLDQRLTQEVAQAVRVGKPLALIMCDLDHFKRLNDSYGHPFGDEVLEAFARILAGGRVSDIACRYGGEEFCVILPGEDAKTAAAVAERIRAGIRAARWPSHAGLTITASLGVADLDRSADQTPLGLVHAADAALYRAKQEGRDRVVLAAIPGPPMKLTA